MKANPGGQIDPLLGSYMTPVIPIAGIRLIRV